MKKRSGSDMSEIDEKLTEEEQRFLLRVVRETIERLCRKERPLEYDVKKSIFERKCGAFVTLHKNNRLRGCIGYVKAIKPLIATVVEMAEAAAMRDPRFSPVTGDEVSELDIEISVLSPLRAIENIEEIVVGIHGILVEKEFHSGLLLPQVATEYGWDRQTFLENTCRKAGLPVDAWKEKDTNLSIFAAQVFGEKDFA
jgi:AmmeMemoRadiSam system protein A